MVKWCISAEVLFNKFDNHFFAPWMKSLQLEFSGVGRQTMHNDCIDKLKVMGQELRDELQNLNSHICLTSDLWTSNQKLGYNCFSTHYIDANFVLKKTIAYKEVKYPHTSLALEERQLQDVSSSVGVKKKVFTITLDNASNNMSACDPSRKWRF
jgi:hypothetical protein